jgi:xylan 1,4-beta-xylosidase
MIDNLPAFSKPWSRCVGSERLSTMLRKEYWDRFREVQAVMGFEYIRCHGLLCDELGLFRVDEWGGEKKVFYNHTYIDQILDALLEEGVRPFVELGFMPGAMASGDQTVFWWKGNVTPPADWDLWSGLVRELVSHWIARYGAEEVRRWPIEVWNEPNLEQFWQGASMENYFRLYECSVRAVKAVDPAIRVGGPAICGGSDHWIDAFLAYVREKDLPLDFFSRHLYAGETPSLRSPEFFYQGLSDPARPMEELRSVRARIDKAGFPGLEIHITEFNTSYHPRCPIHDTPLNAAYLARLLSEAGELVRSLSYWTFCDLFEECDVPRSLFHGGFGLLARYGIPKPTFYLFAFFQRLGDRVLYRDGSCLATLRGDGSIAVAAWNPVMEAGAAPSRRIALELPWREAGGGADPRPALVRRSRVHEGAGNPWGLWAAMGRPRYPDSATVDFLKEAAHPALEAAVLQPEGGLVKPSFSLERNEITLLEIGPFADESPSYLGLDDSLIDGYPKEPARRAGLS